MSAGLDVELVGCVLAVAGSLRVLALLERADALYRVWLVFVAALGLALAAMLGAALAVPLGVVVALRVASNLLWAATAVRFAGHLGRAGLGEPLRGGWAALTYASAIATSVLVVAYVWLTASDEGAWAWKIRKLVGVLADAVVLNACIHVVRGLWPMRAARVARPYVYFIVAALAFILRALLDLAGMPPAIDTVAAALAWLAVVAASWEQARLTRALLRR